MATKHPDWDITRLAQKTMWDYRYNKSKKKELAETTFATYVEHLESALAAAVIYSNSPVNFKLSDHPEWKLFKKFIVREKLTHAKFNQPSMTQKEVNQVYANLQAELREAIRMKVDEAEIHMIEETMALLAISWSAAARVGDVLGLFEHVVEVQFASVGPSGKMGVVIKVTYMDGKIAQMVGMPYTVRSRVNPEQGELIRKVFARLRAQAAPGGRLWGSEAYRTKLQSRLVKNLRKVNPLGESYSLRRGALRTLAAIPGMEPSKLQYFSGHTTITSLMTYLGWGVWADGVSHHQMMVSENLWNGPELFDDQLPPEQHNDAVHLVLQ
jgi:hypothetical protein